MRQISTTSPPPSGVGDLAPRLGARGELARPHAPLDREPRLPPAARHAAASADAAEAPRDAPAALACPLAALPSAGALARHRPLASVGLWGGEQHDLCAPPHPRLVALGLV